MPTILVSGLINIETTLKVDSFPVPYTPVEYAFDRVHSSVSGVGYNVAKALTCLGNRVRLLSLIGSDAAAVLVRHALQSDGLDGSAVLPLLSQTPQSVILYDCDGRRRINVDLKHIQESVFPLDVFLLAAQNCELLALCNINFSRPFLKIARTMNKPVATDVHVISSLEDDYNREFMENADILFMSDEALPVPPQEWAAKVMERFPARVLVIGMGAQGALMAVRRDSFIGHFPVESAVSVQNTIGAGDALFSAFLHLYLKTSDPSLSLRKAMRYAGWKISRISASDGFLDENALDAL